MSRNLSATMLEAIFAERSDQVALFLLELYHKDMGPPDTMRLVANNEDVVSNGNTYSAFGCELALPPDFEDRLPQVQITMVNVDRSIVTELRGLSGPIDATWYLVLASDPDTYEAGPYKMKLRNVEHDELIISGILTGDDFWNEPWPKDDLTPENAPGLH